MGLSAKLVSWMPKGQFVKQALLVMIGASAAQLIAILASPAIARLYTPAAFGHFALYSSLVTIAAAIATGRYDVAVLLPKDDRQSDQLAIGALLICACVSLGLQGLVLGWGDVLAATMGAPDMVIWLHMAPAAVFMTATGSTLSYWCNRRMHYRSLTAARIGQALFTSGLAIALGFMEQAGGLIISALAGQCLFVLLLMGVLKTIHLRDNWQLGPILRQYKKFPMVSVPTDLISQLSGQLPRFYLSAYSGSAALGLFFLNQRVLDLPLAVIAGSIREVFSQRANQQYQVEQRCDKLFLSTFRHLLSMALVPSILLFLFAPDIFALVFGERWREAGTYAQIVLPIYFFRFCISPLCMVFYITQKQHQELVWQIVLLLLTCASFGFGVLTRNPKLGLLCYSAMYCFMYVVIFFMALRLSRGDGGRSFFNKNMETLT
jgi:O-antigen/teichoic acid export membrane protein